MVRAELLPEKLTFVTLAISPTAG
ncbi:hypothetical protein LCGC14_2992730, partial [marine sediment metagenome]